jgi:aarF domain-containing kinase
LTGEESKVMIEAHIESVLVVRLPFSELGEFDFGNQGMTKRIYKLMPVMIKID